MNTPKTIGVLGGGQLGRMMADSCHRLGIRMITLDPMGSESPAGQVCHESIKGDFRDEVKIRELAAKCDIITVEIEHVNATVLQALVDQGCEVQPLPSTIALIQDKFLQKQHFASRPIGDKSIVGDFRQIETVDDVKAAGREWGWPVMLKSRLLAYDGRGNAVARDEDQAQQAFDALGGKMLYAEKWVPFTKELAVMVVRGAGDEVRPYCVVETTQHDNICHTVLAPAAIDRAAYEAAQQLALHCVRALPGRGVFGVELFLLADGEVVLNEVAPRPHNSGHYTVDATACCQFQSHIRAVAAMPLGDTSMRVGGAGMLNILGAALPAAAAAGDAAAAAAAVDEQARTTLLPLKRALELPGANTHWYCKAGGIRAGRKLGHINVTAGSPQQAEVLLQKLLQTDEQQQQQQQAAPQVGVIMGSDSDLPCMAAAADVLRRFEVPFELTVVSAHRTARRMVEYAEEAEKRGLRVLICGAGGAAHLPGMVAALTPLPVVGVPVRSSSLQGQDSLLSIVQMPRGVPVATVAIHNAMNAGLLAVRMLGAGGGPDAAAYRDKMQAFMDEQREEVLLKAARLEEVGYEKYLAEMPVKK